jgi:L-arabinose transport system ATP-binding protein
MSEIQQLCQRVAIMRDGELVKSAPTSELSEDEMIRLMVGRPLSRVFPARNGSRGDLAVRMRGVTTDKVHEISLDIHAGEIVGLSGLVGSGRSELAHALYGVDRIVAGTIEVAGSPRAIRSPESAIRWGIGLAPEDRKGQGLFLNRSVSDNVSLTVLRALSRWHVVNAKAEHKVVSKMTQRMRVKARSLASHVSTLSGGNQQKVLLARWVARNPKVLILDEPTRGIDVGAKAEIYQLVNELTESGMAVLLISSELPELLGLADRIHVMRDGRIVQEVPRKDANEETLLRLALGLK